MPSKSTVDKREKWLDDDDKAHELSRALRKGTPEMRRLALEEWKFMRPNPQELEMIPFGVDPSSPSIRDHGMTVYKGRVLRSCMPNAYARSIRRTARMPFRAPIQYGGWDPELMGLEREMPSGTVDRRMGWVDDIDGEGNSLDRFAQERFETALFDGVSYAFVDQDPREFPDVASRRRAGARPYVVPLDRQHIYRITLESTIAGPRIKQLVFYQPIRRADISDPNAWSDEEIPALKVVTAGEEIRDEDGITIIETVPVTTQVYVRDEESGAYIEDPALAGAITSDDRRMPLLDVPLVPFYGGQRVGPFRGSSPFLDSACAQEAVWNHMSELVEAAREMSLAYLHESGVTDINHGATPVLETTRALRYRWSSEPGADLKYVERNGESLGKIQDLVEWLISQIEQEHDQLKSERPSGPVTAREITLEGVHASSFLEMAVILQEHAWKSMLDIMALLGGHSQFGEVSIPHDFGLPNASIDRLLELYKLDKLTAQNYFEAEARAGGIDSEWFDIKAEVAADNAARGVPSAPFVLRNMETREDTDLDAQDEETGDKEDQ